jgi:hypothetical protein
MKTIQCLIVIVFLAVLSSAAVLAVRADDTKDAKPKPYPLDSCLVCGMKFGDTEKPYVFVYKRQEIKVCDKSEKAEFDKSPAKYMKKLDEAKARQQK